MKRVFENTEANYDVQGKYKLHIDREGVAHTSANGKQALDIKFAEIGTIFTLRYCSSNQHYRMIFRNPEGKNLGEIETDVQRRREEQTIQGHNILETKSILIAFAENKLTEAFPNNLDTLDLGIGFTLKEKRISLKEGVLVGAKHQVKLSDIRRVRCVGNGTLNHLLIHTREKEGVLRSAGHESSRQ